MVVVSADVLVVSAPLVSVPEEPPLEESALLPQPVNVTPKTHTHRANKIAVNFLFMSFHPRCYSPSQREKAPWSRLWDQSAFALTAFFWVAFIVAHFRGMSTQNEGSIFDSCILSKKYSHIWVVLVIFESDWYQSCILKWVALCPKKSADAKVLPCISGWNHLLCSFIRSLFQKFFSKPFSSDAKGRDRSRPCVFSEILDFSAWKT